MGGVGTAAAIGLGFSATTAFAAEAKPKVDWNAVRGAVKAILDEEGYDDEYYGYALMGGTQLAFDREREASDEEGDSDQTAPAHPLYHRPADQPATPWSAGGAELT